MFALWYREYRTRDVYRQEMLNETNLIRRDYSRRFEELHEAEARLERRYQERVKALYPKL